VETLIYHAGSNRTWTFNLSLVPRQNDSIQIGEEIFFVNMVHHYVDKNEFIVSVLTKKEIFPWRNKKAEDHQGAGR